LFYNKIKIP
jgi:hypothetical protein